MLPDIGRVILEDAETGEQIEINTSNHAVRERHARAIAATTEDRLRELKRKGVDTISLRTNADYVPALRNYFRTRERRLQLRA